MYNKIIISTLVLVIVFLLGTVVYLQYQLEPQSYGNETEEDTASDINVSDIGLDNLSEGDTISSPLSILGTVDDSWFEEGKSLLVEVRDESGAVLGSAYATEGEYISGTSRVQFTATVDYLTAPVSRDGEVTFIDETQNVADTLGEDSIVTPGVMYSIPVVLQGQESDLDPDAVSE